MQFPLDEIYVAFGDGSETPEGCYYGLALIPERFVKQAELLLEQIKEKYGVKTNSPLHCMEIFSGSRRAKSAWAHLNVSEISVLCGEFLELMSQFSPLYLAGFTPKEHYPKRFRLKGRDGHPDLVHDVDTKYLTLLIYQRLAASFDPVEISPPEDPTVIPQPLNKPWWRVEVKRDDPGIKVKNIYLDRETTRIKWFSKTFQWVTVAKELVINNPSFGQSYLPVQVVNESDTKHPLLEWADLFVYSVGRGLGQRTMELGNFKGKVDLCVLGQVQEEMVVGGEFMEVPDSNFICNEFAIRANGNYGNTHSTLSLEMRTPNGGMIVAVFEAGNILALQEHINRAIQTIPSLGKF